VSEDRTAEEPRWLTEAMLLVIHARQIERYGGAHGVVDQNVVGSALARPINRWAYDDGADVADLAAAYLVGFARSQGFNDGNKRTGLASALVFLRLNGYALHVEGKELYALTMQVATGDAGDDIVAAYLRS
jgi:death on curing protein